MKRLVIEPRPNWKKDVERMGLSFHTIDGERYWDESACYEFTADEIDEIEKATQAINDMTLEVAQRIVSENLFSKLGIPDYLALPITNSWDLDEPTIYGRYDFCCRPGEKPKLLEYNADTPTALLEAAVIQWHWLQDTHANMDQFNSIHEKLIERWNRLSFVRTETIHFASIKNHDEDYWTTNYLRDTAIQAGFSTEFVHLEDIGWWHEHMT